MGSSLIRSILSAALLTAALLVPSASADDVAAIDPRARIGTAGWRVDGVTGVATVRRGAGDGTRLAVGQVVTVGSDVETGPGAVVFLSRDGDRLVVQPNTRMRVAEPEPGGLLDRFTQSLGSVFYDVEPRNNRSFGVDAPYVAAVVKGTRFLVTVEPAMNSVRVDEGRVLVSATDGTASVLVDAGHIAIVAPGLAPGIRLAESGVPAAAPLEGDVAGVGDPVNEVVNETGDAVGNLADGAGDAVGGTSNAVGNAVGDAGDSVGNAIGGSVGDAVGQAAGGVGGIVGGLGGAVGGLLGKN
jgi:ferric-dicitrate binding protein FerR (iron transport regulator)